MKKSINNIKLLLIFVILICVFFGSYYLKSRLNQENIENKNYLATTIRTQKERRVDENPLYVDEALDREGFIKYGKENFNKKEQHQFFEMKNISKYNDGKLMEEKSQLVSVGLFIDDKHQILYIKQAYNLGEKISGHQLFRIVSTGELNLKVKELSYRISLINPIIQPNQFINALDSLVNEINSRYPSTTFVSKITIEAGNDTYIYHSNQPNYLIKLEHLS